MKRSKRGSAAHRKKISIAMRAHYQAKRNKRKRKAA